MKITIELNDKFIKCMKEYIKNTLDISRPTKKDIAAELMQAIDVNYDSNYEFNDYYNSVD